MYSSSAQVKKYIAFLGIWVITASQGIAAVTARAGVAQRNVTSTNTSVSVATTNTVVDTDCQTKFDGCLDAFCVSDNIDGGRCQCSAQHAKLANELAQIKKSEQQSYMLATAGVDMVENGTDTATSRPVTTRSARVDLSQWNIRTITEDQQVTGAALLTQALDTCRNQLPECTERWDFLRTIYSQKIKSDCKAFENAIAQNRTAAQTRTTDAERAVRTTAYKKLQAANEYDLGRCTIEYKKCMSTTGGCGDDFRGCVAIAASENAQRRVGSRSASKTYDIVGSQTKISIAASSYEILESKKPICDSVLNKCQNVRDQVWGAFLREAGPEIKNAELLAESDMRTSCMTNISTCIVNACRDNIDPNNPDGSYDMCLSRPESVKSLCKVEIEPCERAEPLILNYVYARLAAMRVDACTIEVKQCLEDDGRCGKDYLNCVGLDTDTIIRMCPYDKLTGCQKVYQETDIRGDKVYDELYNLVQGIMLDIDNSLLTFCQNAVDEAMIRTCGDTQNCNNMIADKNIGAGSLNYGLCYYTVKNDDISIDYTKCFNDVSQIRDVDLGRVYGSTTGKLGPVVPFMSLIDGVIFWELVTVDEDGKLTGADEYFKLSGSTQMPEPTQELVRQQLVSLQTSVNDTIDAIENDPTVKYCMSGRKIRGMKNVPGGSTQVPRFPSLTKSMRSIIATSALKVAKNNYYKKYDELSERQMQDYVTIAERQAEIKGENAKDVRREAARQACISLADASALPMSPPPPNGFGMWLVAGIVTVIGAVVTVVTLGTAGPGVGAGLTLLWSAVASGSVAAIGSAGAVAVVAAAGVAMTASGALIAAGTGIAEHTQNLKDGYTISMQLQMNGHHELNQWNYKQITDTTFDWDTLNCHKCVESTKCIKTSYPLFGQPKCKKWEEKSTTDCTDTQF